jgi:hypothetical protein
MQVNEIIHLVRARDSDLHILYLRDGRIVCISPFDGTVSSVTKLPRDEVIAQVQAQQSQ